MNIEIKENLSLEIYGFSGVAAGDYASMAFQLSGRMWKVVKENGIKNKGMNIWVYDKHHEVFAGVELEQDSSLLEKRNLHLPKYAYYKHIGPYKLLKSVGQQMIQEIKSKGYEVIFPSIEIYGHWNNDESKLETELLMCLK